MLFRDCNFVKIAVFKSVKDIKKKKYHTNNYEITNKIGIALLYAFNLVELDLCDEISDKCPRPL